MLWKNEKHFQPGKIIRGYLDLCSTCVRNFFNKFENQTWPVKILKNVVQFSSLLPFSDWHPERIHWSITGHLNLLNLSFEAREMHYYH